MLSLTHHHRRHVFAVGVMMAAIVVLAGAVMILLIHPSAGRVAQPISPAQTAVPTATSAETKMLVMGDIYWGRYINDWSMASPLKYAYPFQSLGDFNRPNYDAWVANMECPVTNNPKVRSSVEDSTLTFDCSPDYLPEAGKWFSAVSLANNHTGNQGGAVGLDETRLHLAENGMQNFGTYDPEDTSNLCDVLSIPTQVVLSDGSTKQGNLPIAWCGYHGVFATPSAASVATMQRYAERFTVVAMPHSGKEYQPGPDQIKTTLYRALIDNGADVVIGNHAHWVQTSEAYKGKLIMYSLGNFIFDQQLAPEMTRSAVLSIQASVMVLDGPSLDRQLALGELCKAYKDTCLERAEQQQLQKLPLQLHFSVQGSVDTGKVTRRANDEQLAGIKQRLNWTTTIANLNGMSSGE